MALKSLQANLKQREKIKREFEKTVQHIKVRIDSTDTLHD